MHKKYYSLTSSEREFNLKCPDVFFTIPQMIELKNRLNLFEDDYVSSGMSYTLIEKTTIEYLIGQTETYLRLFHQWERDQYMTFY